MKNRLIASIMALAMAASAAAVLPTATASADWEFQNNNWYYYDEDGNMVKNDVIYDEDYDGWYYLGSDGAMTHDTIMYHPDGDLDYLCYYGSDGKMVKDKLQYISVLGKYMFLDSCGMAQKDIRVCNESGDYYIADDSFSLSDTWLYDSCSDYYYYYGSDSRMIKDDWVYDYGSQMWFYADSDGVIEDENEEIDPTNLYIISCNGDLDFYNDDQLLEWVPELGKYKHTTGLKDHGYILDDGNSYFFDSESLSLKNTWLYTDIMTPNSGEGYYYFGDDCTMVVNTYIHDDATGHDFFVDENGRLVDDGSGIVPGNVYICVESGDFK